MAGHVVARIDLVRAAHVLDDVEALADREHLGRVLHGVGEVARIARGLDHDAIGRADPFVLDDRGAARGQRLAYPPDRGLGVGALAGEKAQL